MPDPSSQKAGSKLDTPVVLIERRDPQRIERVVDHSAFMASLYHHRKMDLVGPDMNRFDLCDDAVMPVFIGETGFGGSTRCNRLLSAIEGPKASQRQAGMGIIQRSSESLVVLRIKGVNERAGSGNRVGFRAQC